MPSSGMSTIEEIVMVRDIPFYSSCEHHLVPFHGKAHVAYIPHGRVTGLSKLARLIEGFARRPQMQERLTAQVADALMDRLQPLGVMVVVEAEHLCMSMRGVRKPGSITVTSAVRGHTRHEPHNEGRGDRPHEGHVNHGGLMSPPVERLDDPGGGEELAAAGIRSPARPAADHGSRQRDSRLVQRRRRSTWRPGRRSSGACRLIEEGADLIDVGRRVDPARRCPDLGRPKNSAGSCPLLRAWPQPGPWCRSIRPRQWLPSRRWRPGR